MPEMLTANKIRNMYQAFRPLLFRIDPESSHNLSLKALHRLYNLPKGAKLIQRLSGGTPKRLPSKVMGIEFPNPVGLAAGLDKNAEFIEPLSCLGFGWIEVGTVTPLPQSGNPRPRLFRITDHAAIINRMGFNNCGVQRFVENIKRMPKSCIIGANIGKNKDTPLEQASKDYILGMTSVYPYVDYIAINISSPNTSGLRALQERQALYHLLTHLKESQAHLNHIYKKYVPLAIKIAPDLDGDQLRQIANTVLETRIDCIIATNTTVTRRGIEASRYAHETGGMSGKPLRSLATIATQTLFHELKGRVPIVGVGGISNGAEAWDRLIAGADLLQIYTALVYEGPRLAKKIICDLGKKVRISGAQTLQDALAIARKKKTPYIEQDV